ncbi:MAG: site-2 protease family protein [Candidatus Berkelbacteria bacterium]|nr:site-2 protease family protein [Candidatus Berkelbacteria bacterium]
MLILFLALSNKPGMIYYVIGALLGIFIGIVVHEYAHAWMANRLGDPTAKNLGRLTLNPLRHLDPLGTIMLLVIGIGWGKPVPYNPDYLRHGKKDELKIALAGPTINVIFAMIFALPYRFLFLNPNLVENPFFIITGAMTEFLLLLAVFNILPIPPLDGSKIIFIFVSDKTRLSLEKIGPLILIGLLFINYFFRINIFGFLWLAVFWLAHFVRTFP